MLGLTVLLEMMLGMMRVAWDEGRDTGGGGGRDTAGARGEGGAASSSAIERGRG